MPLLNGTSIKDAVLYTNLHVGGIAVCFVLGSYAVLPISPNVSLLILAFCGTFLVYQFERALYPAPEDVFTQPDRVAWISRHQGYVLVSSGLAAIGSVATLPWLRVETLGVGVWLLIAGLLYRLPVGSKKRRLKEMWFLKPVVISGAWAVGGVWLPALQEGVILTPAIVFLVVYRFLFVLPNTLMVDWPDREGDRRAGLNTVASRFTMKQMQAVCSVALLGALGLGIFMLFVLEIPRIFIVDLAGPLLLWAVIVRSRFSTRRFYGLMLDLVIAWPGVTAFCAWMLKG